MADRKLGRLVYLITQYRSDGSVVKNMIRFGNAGVHLSPKWIKNGCTVVVNRLRSTD